MIANNLEKYQNIYIYGAGKEGRKVYNALTFFKVPVQNFVISKYDGAYCFEREVIELSQVKTHPDESFFIVTVPKQHQEDVISNLKERGYNNYIVWASSELNELWRSADYTFEDRRKNKEKCCFILSGYKEFLWEDVFARIEAFAPDDIDFCIISSGLYNEKLSAKAKANNWSYLATKVNSVTIIQNVAMALFEDYKWVYKIDEDMFITKDSFEKLYACYKDVEQTGEYHVGIVAPLIPVNGYGYKRVLKEIGKEEAYIARFGTIVSGGNPASEIEKNPETAVFMWNDTMQLDQLNRHFEEIGNPAICGVRFSIGFILMKHSFWDNMNGFFVSGNHDMGRDEEEVCSTCIVNSEAIVIAENTVVGHFSFGKQTAAMKEYYNDNREWFSVQ